MADYADNINPLDYKYKAKVYIQELAGTYKTNVIVRMELKAADFNFDLAQSSGDDFRLAEQANGSGVFKMWKPVWVQSGEFALMYFKIPVMFADQLLELTAFWGNETVSNISDPTVMDALFIQEFNSSPLDYTRWGASYTTVGLSQGLNEYGYRLNWSANTYYIYTIDTPFTNVKEWIFEAGGFIEEGAYLASQRSFRFYFDGTQNPFDVSYYGSDNTYGMRHNVTYGDSTYSNITECEGLECNTSAYTYNQLYIAYRESVDRVYFKLTNRPTLDDFSSSWERKVEDETHLTVPRIYAYQYEGIDGPIFRLKWLLLRNYSDGAEVSDFDLSKLYIEDENVPHQIIDHEEYGNDITHVNFEHTSSSGNSYLLSDNLYDSISHSWSVDDITETVWATINFGGGTDLTDETYRHYDSGHVRYLNASKLSNDTDDVNDNNYWQGTTSSGYACIDFGLNNNQAISGLSVHAVPNALDNMPKDIIFQAGNSDPRLADDDRWVTLYEGNFEYEEDPQYVFFKNDSYYRYYKLTVLSTFTGADIKLYTWGMYKHVEQAGKKVVAKLRLLPLVGGDYEYNFPKSIRFSASNDGMAWTSLFDTDYRDTYTPLYDFGNSRWQEYSFENIIGYYMYRLECNGNWESINNSMIIAEWEMYEKLTEEYTHRILAGDSNDYNGIWLLTDSTFDDVSFLASNNVLNMVSNDKLIYYESFSGDISGQGPPTVGVGNYGDTYLDITTGSVYIKDIPVYGPDRTGTGTASASFYDTGYPPENAFDDNNNTYFSTDGYTENEPQWLQYDVGVGNAFVARAINTYQEYWHHFVTFTFMGSNDGTTWTTLLIESGIEQLDKIKQIFIFDNVVAYRYYRIYGDVVHQAGHGLYMFTMHEMEIVELDYYDWRLISRGSEINDVNAI